MRALALGLLLTLAATPALAQARLGEPAPDFTLTDSDGVSHTLSDLHGRVVVLWMVGYA